MKTFLCLFLILATVSAQRGKGGKGRPTNAPTEAPTNAPTEAPTAAPTTTGSDGSDSEVSMPSNQQVYQKVFF